MKNSFKVILLLTVVALLIIWCGGLLGGQQGRMVAFVIAVAMNLGSYGFSDRIVLAMHRAQPLAEEEAPEVFNIVRGLSKKAGVAMPRLYMLPSASANAFSAGSGPKRSVIAITHGLVGLLNEEELSGVLGHELAHILNREILFSSIVATLAGALSMVASISRWPFWGGRECDKHDRGHPLALILILIVMLFVAVLIQCAMPRTREYNADVRGAELCGEPLYLVSALRKMDVFSRRLPLRDEVPATAHLFIMNPLSGKGWSSLFNTHPLVENRIALLEK